MVENRDRSLPVPEDMEFQQRAWRAERIAWGVMGIFVLLALLGLFSSGFFSAASTATPDGAVTVDYDRFARKTARSNFSIRIAAPLPAETLVRMSPAFEQFYVIESLYPQAVRSTAGAAGLEFFFAPSAAGDLSIHIAARAQRFGVARLEIEAADRGSVAFTQIIYP